MIRTGKGLKEYASIGRRGVAAVLDVAALFLLGYLVALATGNTTKVGYELTDGPAILPFFLWFLYYISMEATLGATIGKLMVGIRVVSLEGSSIGWSSSVIRNALRLVDGVVFYLIGIIFVLTSAERQRLGDRVASTVVVRT